MSPRYLAVQTVRIGLQESPWEVDARRHRISLSLRVIQNAEPDPRIAGPVQDSQRRRDMVAPTHMNPESNLLCGPVPCSEACLQWSLS